MGLDMYLYKKTYVKQWDHIPDEKQFKVTVRRGGKIFKPIQSKRIKFIIEEVGYWRKANHIHKWFVDNVQDGKDECQESYVDHDNLKTLLDLCKQVKKDKTKAPELLPSQGGFFFGSTDYDEWYFRDINDTIKIIEDLMKEEDFESCDFYYDSSW